jgi:tetratricopeptide (TPR) repeat protein
MIQDINPNNLIEPLRIVELYLEEEKYQEAMELLKTVHTAVDPTSDFKFKILIKKAECILSSQNREKFDEAEEFLNELEFKFTEIPTVNVLGSAINLIFSPEKRIVIDEHCVGKNEVLILKAALDIYKGNFTRARNSLNQTEDLCEFRKQGMLLFTYNYLFLKALNTQINNSEIKNEIEFYRKEIKNFPSVVYQHKEEIKSGEDTQNEVREKLLNQYAPVFEFFIEDQFFTSRKLKKIERLTQTSEKQGQNGLKKEKEKVPDLKDENDKQKESSPKEKVKKKHKKKK